MDELFFGFVSTFGLPVVAVSAFLSCLAMPIPTFAVMLAGGAFAASGDLVLWQVVATAYASAVLGDQAGFQIGRLGGATVVARLERNPTRAALVGKARRTVDRWGGPGVFFSTWLFAALGPWVNLIAGAMRMSWLRFTVWDALGEAIWVTVYVYLGFVFAERLPELADMAGDAAGLVTSLFLVAGLGLLIVRAARRARGRRKAGGGLAR